MTTTERTELKNLDNLQPGDLIEVELSLTGGNWLIYTRLALIEERFKRSYTNLEFVRADYSGIDSGIVRYHYKVIIPPTLDPADNIQRAGVSGTAIIAAVTVIAGGLLAYFSINKIYKITQSPAGAIVAGGSGVFLAAAGIAVIWYVWGLLKR